MAVLLELASANTNSNLASATTNSKENLYQRCCSSRLLTTKRNSGITGWHGDQAILEAHNDRKLLSIQLLLQASVEQRGCWSSFQLLDSKLGSSSLKNLNSDACNLHLHMLLWWLWLQCSTKPSQLLHRVYLRTSKSWSNLNHRAIWLMFLLEPRHSIELLSSHRDHGSSIPHLFTNCIDPWLNCTITHIFRDLGLQLLIVEAKPRTYLIMLELRRLRCNTNHRFLHMNRTWLRWCIGEQLRRLLCFQLAFFRFLVFFYKLLIELSFYSKLVEVKSGECLERCPFQKILIESRSFSENYHRV